MARARSVVGDLAQQVGGQRGRACRVQRRQRQSGAGQGRVRLAVVAANDQYQGVEPAQRLAQIVEQLARGRVQPLGAFEAEQQRRLRRAAGQQLLHGSKQALLLAGGDPRLQG